VTDHPEIAALLRALADRVEQLDVAQVLGELEVLRVRLWAAATRSNAPQSPSERLLTAAEVSSSTRLSIAWLYRNANKLPFARRIGRKVLFAEKGLTKWLAHKAP
jgi:predicted DNA-binding transcriptional regulator AlpA